VLLLWQSYEDQMGSLVEAWNGVPMRNLSLERRPNAESWLDMWFRASTQAPAEVAVLSPPKVQNPAILDMIIANSRLSHDFKPPFTASQR
jgi:hypothetical protein